MTIVFEIIGWVIIAIITNGILMYRMPEEWGQEDAWLGGLICLMGWPFILLIGIGYFILKRLSYLSIMITGFLDKMGGSK